MGRERVNNSLSRAISSTKKAWRLSDGENKAREKAWDGE
jgi:hypothetical protein